MATLRGIVAGGLGYLAGLVVLLTLSFSYGSLYEIANFDFSIVVLVLFIAVSVAVTMLLRQVVPAPAQSSWLTLACLCLLTFPFAAWLVSFMNVCASSNSFPIPGLRC